jgi:hypothetical protein
VKRAKKWQRIEEAVARYVALYGLDRWDIDVYQQEPNDDSMAKAHAEPEYRRAKLTFCPDDIPPAEIDRYVRHELGHVLIWPLCHAAYHLAGNDHAKQEMVRLALERVATDLECAPFWDRVEKT